MEQVVWWHIGFGVEETRKVTVNEWFNDGKTSDGRDIWVRVHPTVTKKDGIPYCNKDYEYGERPIGPTLHDFILTSKKRIM